ncbi:reverse transcriptase domain-containing protein [Tanacetum coccineum]
MNNNRPYYILRVIMSWLLLVLFLSVTEKKECLFSCERGFAKEAAIWTVYMGWGLRERDVFVWGSKNRVLKGLTSNSSGHDMPNAVVVVACMGIDKQDGHNDNPNANDNDVNQGIDPMSTCSGPDMHLAEVAVAGMEIDKGDGHIDIPTASDNDVNLAKYVSVNDPMPISVSPDMLNAEVAICSMGFQNEVAPNAVYEGNVVSAKEAGLDVLIQVACDGMGINKADGYSQCEPFTLNTLIEGFDSQNNNLGIDFLQHDDHVYCFVAKPNDHLTADIGVKPVHNEFVDDFMDVLNDEESLLKVTLDDMNVDEQEKKLIDTVKRKKSDMKTNYVLRSIKEKKKRLAMVLESPFGQQPTTTPVLPKRISRSVNCDFILPLDFEEPKMRLINELMTMEVFVKHIDLWVDLKWCFKQPDADWAMVSPHFLPCTLGLLKEETMVAKHEENIATTAYFVSQRARGFTELRHSNKPIVEAATADVMGHKVQVYMENSQSFQYVDIQGNVGSFFVDVWTGGLMCYVDLAKEKLKAVKARLNFKETSHHSELGTPTRRRGLKERLRPRYVRSRSGSPKLSCGRYELPKKKGSERKTVFKRLEKGIFHRLGDKGKSVSVYSDESRRRSYHSSHRDTKSCHQSSRSRTTEPASERRYNKRASSRRTEELSESEGSAGDPFTPRICYFDFPKTRMPSHIKTYDGSEDPEDPLKIFQLAAKTERWAMPTWCHMFNSTLTGNARVWFDDLPKETIYSYDDLKKAFLENYLQQKKCIKDPVEIHNIRQRDEESTKEFVQRYKLECRDVKGAPECMKISRFMHGITNPELIKRLHDKIPKSVDEIMRLIKSKISKKEAFGTNKGISFPPLGEDEGIEGPMIIEAEIEGHYVHRMYVDGGSASEILKLVEAGIIREVHYHDWLSNPVMVRKHDNSWRICVEFKDLNKACPKDGYPLSEIDWKVESLCGFPFKCFLDAYKGYHQIQMAKEMLVKDTRSQDGIDDKDNDKGSKSRSQSMKEQTYNKEQRKRPRPHELKRQKQSHLSHEGVSSMNSLRGRLLASKY